jgi:hypothetical protein
VKVLARIYFSITGGGGKKERENISCSPHRKWEQRLNMVVPTLSFIVESWGIHVVKDNGSRWLRWLTGRGHPPKSHPKLEAIGIL